MRSIAVFFVLVSAQRVSAGDTLFTHPVYPPIVYEGGEYNFYKYTPKYIPKNLLHCFKILGTTDPAVLERFRKRPVEQVMERGLYEDAYRIRKEFCLEGFSEFTRFFHRRGIYSPWAMQTYILLSFHQYLNQEPIRWGGNKRLALKDIRHDNRSWKVHGAYIKDPDRDKNNVPVQEEQEKTTFDEIEEQFFTY